MAFRLNRLKNYLYSLFIIYLSTHWSKRCVPSGLSMYIMLIPFNQFPAPTEVLGCLQGILKTYLHWTKLRELVFDFVSEIDLIKWEIKLRNQILSHFVNRFCNNCGKVFGRLCSQLSANPTIVEINLIINFIASGTAVTENSIQKVIKRNNVQVWFHVTCLLKFRWLFFGCALTWMVYIKTSVSNPGYAI